MSGYGELLIESNDKDAYAFLNRYPPGTNIDAVKQHGFYVSFTDGAFQSPDGFVHVYNIDSEGLEHELGGRPYRAET